MTIEHPKVPKRVRAGRDVWVVRVVRAVAVVLAGLAAVGWGLEFGIKVGAAEPCVPDTLLHVLQKPAPAGGTRFGWAVAVSGNLTVVGAAFDDAGATDAGTAYVFNAATGALVATLNNPAPAAFDFFGESVAISGNLAVVGASWDDPGGVVYVGTAYVFDASSGDLMATLSNPDPAAHDYFGHSVAISGNVAVVGAWGYGAGATGVGMAYIFDATTGALLTTLSNPAPAGFGFFGESVAISGNMAVVGAYQDDAGAASAGTAYVFNASTGALVATLNNPAPTVGDSFGESVAISGNVAVVGASEDDAGAENAGTAYVFNATTGALVATLNNPAPDWEDEFGHSVAISGTMVVVGALQEDARGDEAGAAYVFSAMTGAFVATLNDRAAWELEYFGVSVAISGNVAVVGSRNYGVEAIDGGSAQTFTCAPALSERMRDHLLGLIVNTAGLDLNGDGLIDIADLLLANLQSP